MIQKKYLVSGRTGEDLSGVLFKAPGEVALI
jgi:hypothetical protein